MKKTRKIWASRSVGEGSIHFWKQRPWPPTSEGDIFRGKLPTDWLTGECVEDIEKFTGFTLKEGECVQVEVEIRKVKT